MNLRRKRILQSSGDENSKSESENSRGNSATKQSKTEYSNDQPNDESESAEETGQINKSIVHLLIDLEGVLAQNPVQSALIEEVFIAPFLERLQVDGQLNWTPYIEALVNHKRIPDSGDDEEEEEDGFRTELFTAWNLCATGRLIHELGQPKPKFRDLWEVYQDRLLADLIKPLPAATETNLIMSLAAFVLNYSQSDVQHLFTNVDLRRYLTNVVVRARSDDRQTSWTSLVGALIILHVYLSPYVESCIMKPEMGPMTPTVLPNLDRFTEKLRELEDAEGARLKHLGPQRLYRLQVVILCRLLRHMMAPSTELKDYYLFQAPRPQRNISYGPWLFGSSYHSTCYQLTTPVQDLPGHRYYFEVLLMGHSGAGGQSRVGFSRAIYSRHLEPSSEGAGATTPRRILGSHLYDLEARQELMNGRSRRETGEPKGPIRAGSRIGILLKTDDHSVRFYLNGERIQFEASEAPPDPTLARSFFDAFDLDGPRRYYPTVILSGLQQAVVLLARSTWRHKPEGDEEEVHELKSLGTQGTGQKESCLFDCLEALVSDGG